MLREIQKSLHDAFIIDASVKLVDKALHQSNDFGELIDEHFDVVRLHGNLLWVLLDWRQNAGLQLAAASTNMNAQSQSARRVEG